MLYIFIAMEDRVPAFESVDDVMAGVYRKMKPEQGKGLREIWEGLLEGTRK